MSQSSDKTANHRGSGRAHGIDGAQEFGMPELVAQFLDGAPAGTERVLANLAIPESLTNEIAYRLYDISPIDRIDARTFVAVLQKSNLIQPRNSEWSFESSARLSLIKSKFSSAETSKQVHAAMLEESYGAKPEAAGYITPNYLYTTAGRAYHLAGIGSVSEAIDAYAEAAIAPYSGAQWLAGKLADEQERFGILPADQSELLFLRAITLYREGKRLEAKPLFERVVQKNIPSRATAMALNILGNTLSKSNPDRAEALLRAGINMSLSVNNEHGVAIGQHNLGQLVGRDRRRFSEAIGLLRSSISLGDHAGNEHHSLVVRHSLGDLIRKMGPTAMREEAENQLRYAIGGLLMLDDRAGAGSAMHTLALLLSRISHRSEEAASLYRRSIIIAEQTHDDIGLGMRLMSLARHIRKHDRNDDEERLILLRAKQIYLSFSSRSNINAIDKMLSEI